MENKGPWIHENYRSLPFLVFEWPLNEETYQPRNGGKDEPPLCANRWMESMGTVILIASGIRAYLVNQLHNILHYEISGRMVEIAEKQAKRITKTRRTQPLKLVVVRPGENTVLPMITVLWLSATEVEGLGLEDILQRLRSASPDPARNNIWLCRHWVLWKQQHRAGAFSVGDCKT